MTKFPLTFIPVFHTTRIFNFKCGAFRSMGRQLFLSNPFYLCHTRKSSIKGMFLKIGCHLNLSTPSMAFVFTKLIYYKII